jgi:hypothetical protein
MTASLLLQVLPFLIDYIKYLQYLPAGIDTVKKLVALIKQIIGTVKQGDVTPEEWAKHKAEVENWKNESWWQVEPDPVDPSPTK